ncbi:MAG: lysophospholipid acyltransferase family protein [Methylococcales bacterium]
MLRSLFYLLIVKPLVLFIVGINARGREHLPGTGPAIVVANHNSHLDTLALMSLFPQAVINKVRPVAAADYFFRNPYLKWFALNIIGIIPIERRPSAKNTHILAEAIAALDDGAILILFPEGTRGEPEAMGKLKTGIAHLVNERPDIAVIPVFFHGLGKCLPKGEFLLVPFFVDAFISEPIHWQTDRQTFMTMLENQFKQLQGKLTALDENV